MSYAALALVFVAAALSVLLVVTALRRPGRRWWAATGAVTVVLVGLTVVFDSVMIAADLFRFDEAALSGVRLVLAPIEDLAWPIAAVAVLPSLWLLLGGGEE
jgi:lycopene cyclase domain-containing protein